MNAIKHYWPTICVAGAWFWSRLRSSLPLYGTPNFFKTWAYDFVKGNSAKQPPV